VSDLRVDRIVTKGTFSLDGGAWDVENNVWLIGDEKTALVVDPAHDENAVMTALGGRTVAAIVCTHAHDDHVNRAPALAASTGAPILLHPAEGELWQLTHPDVRPDRPLADGDVVSVGGVDLHVVHTPGHSPGGVSLYAPDLGTLFSGDTLFAGGPGATGRSFSDFATIVASIRDRLLTLPADTTVRTGHGESTTIGAEAPHLDEWIARGY
jgi:glyoxylase-like metal-dependent hydrolase (beta-lactamase superfamily II)